ncbi:hypothetical protein [Candidatus Protochlamydia amoebophila]|uniref:hypothetical protein n=1 Tax=Candidatus Protochlamydia amoebophila TaxID=362787 RepID=UPI001BC9BB36|nr:hypothetical protein [Candidatus Protochlamydia amoebophila]
MINSTSLQSVTEGAYRINSCLTEGRFDYKKAKQEASSLYQEGLKLLIAEINKKPIIKKNVFPVVCVLNDILSLEIVQHTEALHKSLSKVYRIFIEITSFQYYHQGTLKISNKTRDAMIGNSTAMLSLLPENEIGVRFEYRCAEQATKCLKVVKSALKRYSGHLLDIGESTEGTSFFGILKGSKGFLKEAKKDWVHEWYPPVLELRWISAGIKKQADFKDIIEVRLKNFQEKGKEYTICLATIFVDLIKNKDPEVSNNVRMLAANNLANLFLCKDEDRVSKTVNTVLKILPDTKVVQNVVKNEDRYWNTRILIMQSLLKLVKDRTLSEYIQIILPSLDEVQMATNHKLEKRKIQKILMQLENRIEEYQEIIEEDKAILEANKEEQRDEEDIQELEAKLKNDEKEKQETEIYLDKINLAEKALDELHKEEADYLNRLKTIWNSYA